MLKLMEVIKAYYAVDIQVINGEKLSLFALIGDTSAIDESRIAAVDCVERIIHVTEPYRKANRLFHPGNSEVEAGGIITGGTGITLAAGPCSVENTEQIIGIAKAVKASGAHFLRGGAFKPRTSPYSFQGLKYEGLDLLCRAKEETGLPIISEILSPNDIEVFTEKVDIIQVGARNMQNYDLLRQLGGVRKPVLLKRGLSATISEWLMSAEYIMAGGNDNIILCERGIRTFETYTRNTTDIGAIPVIKRLSHLPVWVDPSHASGKWWMVEPLALASIAAGADGLLIEVHNDPQHALSDGEQSIKPELFDKMVHGIKKIAFAVNRTL